MQDVAAPQEADGAARDALARLARMLPGLDARLAARAARAAAWIAHQGPIAVVHHIDADGVTAGAIAKQALARLGHPHATVAVKSLDEVGIAQVRARLEEMGARAALEGEGKDGHGTSRDGVAATSLREVAAWFCDLGSAAYMHFPTTPRLVCDHHQLVRDGTEESFPHVNPLLDGLPGESVSGAGTAFLVALALDERNLDLAPMALVGAAGDRQDRPAFAGANRAILAAAQQAGLATASTDLAFFGPETRPVRKFLLLADPSVPGLTGDAKAIDRLLRDAGLDPASDTSWSGIEEGQRRMVRTALVEHLLDVGLASQAPGLLREVVRFHHEPSGPLREAQETATLLNSTARYGRADIGLAVAGGDRGDAYQEALGLLLDHRKHLVGALDALAKRPIVTRAAIQHVHLEDAVLDTVVGIVAGMALGGDMGLRQDLPIVAFAFTPDGRTKASSRAPQDLHGRGIDLATAMRDAAAAVGGQGGGHKGAAGATIPRGKEAPFLDALDAMVARQLGIAPLPAPATRSGGPASAPAGSQEGLEGAVPNIVRRPGQQSLASW